MESALQDIKMGRTGAAVVMGRFLGGGGNYKSSSGSAREIWKSGGTFSFDEKGTKKKRLVICRSNFGYQRGGF